MKYFLVLLHVCTTLVAAQGWEGQNPSWQDGAVDSVYEAWVARYNGPGNGYDRAYAIAVDSSGNVYVTGQSSGDYSTIKYDAFGVEQWATLYNGLGNGDDYATALAVDRLGNVYVTGASRGSGGFGKNHDYATIKYDPLGVEQWVARYNGLGNGDDYAFALAIDGSGNVYVTGWGYGLDAHYDYATIKYNTLGLEQWVALYNGSGYGDDYAYALAVDGSGNLYVAGGSYAGASSDYITIKYDTSGVEQWVTSYDGLGNSDVARALAVDSSANVYVTGVSVGPGAFDYATIKYDPLGDEQWVARYNGPGNGDDYPWALGIDHSGNVYVTGWSVGSGENYDYATISYSASGAEQWVARYNGPGNRDDRAYALVVDGSSNVYVTGSSLGSGTNYDYATVGYDASGFERWVARYDGSGNRFDYAWALSVDRSGNVYVTGESDSSAFGDYVTIKYQQTPLAVEGHDGGPTAFSLHQNFPNPFNPVTTISYQLPGRTHATLKVSDILGREMATLVDGVQEAGYKSATFDASNLASGIYFYRITAGSFVQTKKMMLLK